ncbi:hypothetical protein GJAV_G00001040 [Gymnothorax javanicus]|nr:hypothetical protein GJAV_G00001040 [Gymnothorax javanicus]
MRVRVTRIAGQVLPLLSAALLQQHRKRTEDPRLRETWKETGPYWNVTVKILRAKHIPKQDVLSQSDSYISLHLPTASPRAFRTRTVRKSSFPEWNETFRFRVYSRVKNILELNLCDEDFVEVDCSTVLFDLSNLRPGRKERKVFALDPEEKDELWVEFEVEESKEPPGSYITNGVLAAGPSSVLEVKVEKPSEDKERQDLVLKLSGAFEQEEVVRRTGPDSSATQSVVFHMSQDTDSQLEGRQLQEKNKEEDPLKLIQEEADTCIIPLPPVGQQVTLSVPIGQDELDLQLKNKDRSEQLDVRLGFDIPLEEKRFLEKRRAVVSRALQEVLNLPSSPAPQQVPVVAVVGSGGGTRAMTGLCGSLIGLQSLGMLDAVSYITGVSGSTWAMSALYSNRGWSQWALRSLVWELKEQFSKSAFGIFSPSQLLYYQHNLQQKAQTGQLVSFIDFLGLGIEYLINGKENRSTLSSQQRAVIEGQNPFPVYTAVNMKNSISGSPAVSEWCEFTPYEVGIPKYGAFVRAEDFGSEFYMGHLIKRHPETRISYLLGLWSSVLSFNLRQLVFRLMGSVPHWIRGLEDDIHDTGQHNPHAPSALDTYFIEPVGELAETLDNIVTNRPIISKNYNFLFGFDLLWDYGENDGFLAWRDAHLDSFPNEMTPSDTQLHLVDSGFAVNSGFPPILRTHRRVDLIFSFNYSWNRDQFKVLRKTAQYCKDHHMPFPHIDFSALEEQPLRECYLFKDDNNPEAPIVLHFPLICSSFRDYRSPGVRRVGKAEHKDGEVDVESKHSPYRTMNLTYEPEDFQRLVSLTAYNVTNNKEMILQALRLAMEKHADATEQSHAHKHTPEQSQAHNHTPEQSHAHKHTPEQCHTLKHTPEQSPAHKNTPECSPANKHTPEHSNAHKPIPEQSHAHNHTPEQSQAHKHTLEQSHAPTYTPEHSPAQEHSHTPAGVSDRQRRSCAIL